MKILNGGFYIGCKLETKEAGGNVRNWIAGLGGQWGANRSTVKNYAWVYKRSNDKLAKLETFSQ